MEEQVNILPEKRIPKRKPFPDEDYVDIVKKRRKTPKPSIANTQQPKTPTTESKTPKPKTKTPKTETKTPKTKPKFSGAETSTSKAENTTPKWIPKSEKKKPKSPKTQIKTPKTPKSEPKNPKVNVLKPSDIDNKLAGSSAKKLCQRPTCAQSQMSCVLRASKKCNRDGPSARWYHMTKEEHFCNHCFEYYYRPKKEGYKTFETWKARWSSSCRKEGTLKIFINEELMPYWVECVSCDKWRQLDETVVLTRALAAKFKCSDVEHGCCEIEESVAVQEARDISWIHAATCLPYLKDSPAGLYLRDFYYDGIGLSPPLKIPEEAKEGFPENTVPFYSAEDSERARCICADIMTEEERQQFPHLLKFSSLYLGLRNLALTLWNLNPRQYLTYKRCVPYLITRGLCRVTLAEELKKVLDFLTLAGYINFGVLPKPPRYFNASYWNGNVVVIGAGIAGVSAARQLKNAGCNVKVLESSSRCGGRVRDDHSLGNCVGLGAQIITGCINNPLFTLCKQTNVDLRYLGVSCDLISDNGIMPEASLDREVEFRFNLMLDSLEEWKQSINKHEHEGFSLSDALLEQLKELQKTFKNMSQVEKDLLQFHLGNLEYGCGSSLSNVSAVHWNQNEDYPQYSGHHAWCVDGFGSIVEKLAHGINITYNSQVVAVDYSGDQVQIQLRNGETITADKVVCAVPLTVYQSKRIHFNPALPEDKALALDRLGAGLIEKLAMKFPTPFWQSKVKKADIFGHIPSTTESRGLFSLFYDMSRGEDYILMTVIAGEAVKLREELTDEEIAQRCLATLRNIFPEEAVPEPTSYVISSWAQDEDIQMSYSYIKIGSSGKDLDVIAQSTDDKLFFAGEHTNRQFPQTVTGAFLTGLREARKILKPLTT